MKTLYSLVYCLLLLAISVPGRSAAYFDRYEVTTDRSELVDAYIIKPTTLVSDDGDGLYARLNFSWEMGPNAQQAEQILELAATFIDDFSKRSGHLNANTRPFHIRELENLRRGKWPAVVVTRKGVPTDVLLVIAIAVPWGKENLPCQERFSKSGFLPASAFETTPHEQSGFVFPLAILERDLSHFAYRDSLSLLFSQLPWQLGRPAEIKFLVQKEGAKGNLAALGHALITSFGLHRFTPERLTREQIRTQVATMNRPEVKEPLRQALDQAEQSQLNALHSSPETGAHRGSYVRALYAGLRETLWSPNGFQRFAAVSSLYAHVSEREAVTGGSLAKLFLRRFGFPELPILDFNESASFGTEGIRTRIYQLSFKDFDFTTGRSLNANSLELGRGMNWDHPPLLPLSCPQILDEFVGRILKQARPHLPAIGTKVK